MLAPKPVSFKVAQSELIVVKSILSNWRIEEVLLSHGCILSSESVPWSDKLLTKVSNSEIDLAIYNKRHTLDFIRKKPESRVHILADAFYSMGGDHFYLLSKNGVFQNANCESELLDKLEGAKVVVHPGSDHESTFLSLLNASDEELRQRGISIIKAETQVGLSFFELSNEIVLIGGQNLRMMAKYDGGYSEVFSSKHASQDARRLIQASALNCVIASDKLVKFVGMTRLKGLVKNALSNFMALSSDLDAIDRIVHELAMDLATEDLSEKELYAVMSILFNTYRFGGPQE